MKYFWSLVSLVALITFSQLCLALKNDEFPLPFKRTLRLESPPMTGYDVSILQNLLKRDFCCSRLNASGQYDNDTAIGVSALQTELKRPPTGAFGPIEAQAVLDMFMADGYKDDGKIAPGFLYKVYIPVYENRSIEVFATLYDVNMAAKHRFKVRLHGQNHDGTDIALNQMTNGGVTPTGLATFDLNSPEGDPKDFGPYPINRMVKGQAGNAGFLISDLRDGILMHTDGCIHGHPEDIKKVWHILVGMGVEIRPNPGGKLPYPYEPQGIISIEQVDGPTH